MNEINTKSKGKRGNYINCSSCDDKFICPHATRGNFCGTKNGETRPDFGIGSMKEGGVR